MKQLALSCCYDVFKIQQIGRLETNQCFIHSYVTWLVTTNYNLVSGSDSYRWAPLSSSTLRIGVLNLKIILLEWKEDGKEFFKRSLNTISLILVVFEIGIYLICVISTDDAMGKNVFMLGIIKKLLVSNPPPCNILFFTLPLL